MDSLQFGVAAAFFLAGAVKGIAGMGLPTVAIGLLGLVMPPAGAAALLVMPSLITNAAQCLGPYLRRAVQTLWPMWAGLLLGAVTTPFPTLTTAGSAAGIALGLVLVAYCVYGLSRPAIKLKLGARQMLVVSFVVGWMTGAIAAATGLNIFPMVIFLQALDLGRDETVQALGISFVVSTVALAASLGIQTSWRAAWSVSGLLAVIFALAGMLLGARLRRLIPAATFRKVLFVLFGMLGVFMLVKHVG